MLVDVFGITKCVVNNIVCTLRSSYNQVRGEYVCKLLSSCQPVVVIIIKLSFDVNKWNCVYVTFD